MSVNNQSL